MPRECLSIHCGQAGVQTGSAIWELFCLEYGMNPNGLMRLCPSDKEATLAQTFFCRHDSGSYTPRAIFIDMEPSAINVVRTGLFGKLFNPESFIVGKEDAASLFPKGFYSCGREFSTVIMERLRKMVEACDGLQGFNMFRSTGGGTGSGLGSNICSKLETYFGKSSIISYEIIPGPKCQKEIVEPYNALLCNHASEDCHVSFVFDNDSMAKISQVNLRIPNANYYNYNRIFAQVIGGMTTAIRFEGACICDFQTNLVPIPRLRYPLVSYAPFLPYDSCPYDEFVVTSLIADVLNPRHHMVECHPRLGQYMAMVLNFRGNVNQNHIQCVKEILTDQSKAPRKVRFVDWTVPGFKVNISDRPPIGVPGTEFGATSCNVVGLMSSTAVRQPFEVIRRKFELMFNKRAFVHWFLAEGLEEDELKDAHSNMAGLIQDYKDLEVDNCKCHPEHTVKPTARSMKVTACRLGAEAPPENWDTLKTCQYFQQTLNDIKNRKMKEKADGPNESGEKIKPKEKC